MYCYYDFKNTFWDQNLFALMAGFRYKQARYIMVSLFFIKNFLLLLESRRQCMDLIDAGDNVL